MRKDVFDRLERVRQALSEPHSRRELSEMLKIPKSGVQRYLDKLRPEIYIAHWKHSGGPFEAFFVVGEGKDASKPLQTHEEYLVVRRAAWAKRHANQPPRQRKKASKPPTPGQYQPRRDPAVAALFGAP